MHSKTVEAVINAYNDFPDNVPKLMVKQGSPLTSIISSTIPKNFDSVGELDDVSLVNMISSSGSDEASAIHHQNEIEEYANHIAEKVTDSISYALTYVYPKVSACVKQATTEIQSLPSSPSVGNNIKFVAVRLPAIMDLDLFDEYLGRTSKESMADKSILFDPKDALTKLEGEQLTDLLLTGVAYIDEVIKTDYIEPLSVDEIKIILNHAYNEKAILDSRLGRECKMQHSILSFLFHRGLANQVGADGQVNNEHVYRCNNAMAYWGHVINQQVKAYKSEVKKDRLFYMQGVDNRFLDGSWVNETNEPMHITVYAESYASVVNLKIAGGACIGAVLSGHDISVLTPNDIAKNARMYEAAWGSFKDNLMLSFSLKRVGHLSYIIKRIVDGAINEIRANEMDNFRGDIDSELIRDGISNYIYNVFDKTGVPKIGLRQIFIEIIGGLVYNFTNSKDILLSVCTDNNGDGDEGCLVVIDEKMMAEIIINEVSSFILDQVVKA